ncbi:hypothetical protein LQ567_23940 [Niabella pedocola]|uniref:Carboxypeptidase regulatory-like domain-containing protein n=1 Tax=Niabella pedocola TaxID=1752077 RepID=A0ABS8Q0Z7_9BACT|nr:DUF6624 domain-containing protein [Niabella pedocola]MCD2425856.1 hypothetical protein [Niabella pedocola]
MYTIECKSKDSVTVPQSCSGPGSATLYFKLAIPYLLLIPAFGERYIMRLFWILLFLLFYKATPGQTPIPYDRISTVLEDILVKDQAPRDTLNALAAKYGAYADTVARYWKYINKTDSVNTLQVTRIIDQYGWPDQRLISTEASKALWLVVQHGDSLTREKYLPVLKRAAEEGKAPKMYVAYLYDRVQMFRERFQLYGTQMGGDYEGNPVLWPVRAMPKLDARRKAMGLPPIKEALKQYPVSWSDPVCDSLAGKIVFYGLVSNLQGHGLPGISICERNGKLAGKTNERGYFRILASRRALRRGLLFKAAGYRTFVYHFRNKAAEVFFDTVSLTK